MLEMRVDVETKGVLKFLETIQKKQVPFATSQALTDTAFAVRKRTVGPVYDRAFEVRNKRFAGAAFRVTKARKSKLTASVYDSLGRASLALHADGGVKKPRGGNLAIPSSNIRRTSSGKIGKAKQPRGLKKSFVANLRGRGNAVWQRYGKGNSRLRLMYDLERTAKIRKSFRFYEEAEKTTEKEFPKNWEKRFVRAVRTAR